MGANVMVDIETFGVGNKAAIISIGAVKFDQTKIIDKFHVGVNPETSESAGLVLSASTVVWWLDPERAPAWEAWSALEKFDLPLALSGFAMWYADPAIAGNLITDGGFAHKFGEQLPVWGNGATFDNVILRSAFEACGMAYPAKFFNDRCYRTIKSLLPDIKLERTGTHHSAVDDAESQAVHLQRLCAQLGVVL